MRENKLLRILILGVYVAVLSFLFFVVHTVQYARDIDYCAPSTQVDDGGLCKLATVENINDAIFPTLQELLGTSFFRYYKINLERPCPFWKVNPMCSNQGCSIETLPKDPNGWETKLSDIAFPTYQLDRSVFLTWGDGYGKDDFCQLDREGEAGVYVDLIENPERFTGYAGASANKIWQSIYQENCFTSKASLKHESPSLISGSDWEQCMERKVFYRVISGLHASISVHLSDQHYNPLTMQWESNFQEFNERVGKHLERVQNVYLVHMLLYRAIGKLASRLDQIPYSPENPQEQSRILALLNNIVKELPNSPKEFDRLVFSSNTKPTIIEEFKEHFRNVSLIMNCVSCERCRLWGKIQTTGIGTALKVLFLSEDPSKWKDAQFKRSEIIAIFNTFGRFSESIDAIKRFRAHHIQLEQSSTTKTRLLLFFKPIFLATFVMVTLSTLIIRLLR